MAGRPDSAVSGNTKAVLIDNCKGTSRTNLRFCNGVLLFVASLFALPAGAEFFYGIKTGSMMVDVSTDKNPWNLALNLGYRLDTRLADLSLAGEVNRSLRDGETRRGEDLEFESEAIYIAYRSPSSLFYSLRGGVVRDKVIIDGNSSSHDGLLVGAGFGIVAGKSLMQIEYTLIAGDANFLSFSLEF